MTLLEWQNLTLVNKNSSWLNCNLELSTSRVLKYVFSIFKHLITYLVHWFQLVNVCSCYYLFINYVRDNKKNYKCWFKYVNGFQLNYHIHIKMIINLNPQLIQNNYKWFTTKLNIQQNDSIMQIKKWKDCFKCIIVLNLTDVELLLDCLLCDQWLMVYSECLKITFWKNKVSNQI